MTTDPRPDLLSVPDARALAGDLVRSLVDRAGDADAVDAGLRRWLDLLGGDQLSQVALAAVQLLFRECLVPTPVEAMPPGRRMYAHPRERLTR